MALFYTETSKILVEFSPQFQEELHSFQIPRLTTTNTATTNVRNRHLAGSIRESMHEKKTAVGCGLFRICSNCFT
ncbi:hypothetical protein Y032_0004g2180 [Ancylostoma ceylanicum]|uniref:Uncharacterized protein n=1 Tax=Ancylostoma ceylanicum TaxID=53326 RepID=A0A016VXK3_9BILA|nr:hypothetical protein Y032_0004g2180 [Ancylostoma ceylanicum]